MNVTDKDVRTWVKVAVVAAVGGLISYFLNKTISNLLDTH